MRRPLRAAHPLVRHLVKLIKKHGMTGQDFADRFSVSHNTLSSWRRGVCMPTLWTLLEVLDGLGYQIKIERKSND